MATRPYAFPAAIDILAAGSSVARVSRYVSGMFSVCHKSHGNTLISLHPWWDMLLQIHHFSCRYSTPGTTRAIDLSQSKTWLGDRHFLREVCPEKSAARVSNHLTILACDLVRTLN